MGLQDSCPEYDVEVLGDTRLLETKNVAGKLKLSPLGVTDPTQVVVEGGGDGEKAGIRFGLALLEQMRAFMSVGVSSRRLA